VLTVIPVVKLGQVDVKPGRTTKVSMYQPAKSKTSVGFVWGVERMQVYERGLTASAYKTKIDLPALVIG
jgi:hypothetical protein